MELMSAKEAAAYLGLSLPRAYQLIHEGSLPARKVGGGWVIDGSDLERLKSRPPGRPMSPKSAWNFLLGSDRPMEPWEARRVRLARSRLQNGDRESWPDSLRHSVANRAARRLYEVAAADVEDLRSDARVHLSGVSHPRSEISDASLVEGYVRSEHITGLLSEFLAVPSKPSSANVILHVPPASVDVALDRAVASPLVIAADLAEHLGPRERSRAVALAIAAIA